MWRIGTFPLALPTLGDADRERASRCSSPSTTRRPRRLSTRGESRPRKLSGLNKYELLGVDKHGVGVDDKVLKQAYHKALLTYHPDKNSA